MKKDYPGARPQNRLGPAVPFNNCQDRLAQSRRSRRSRCRAKHKHYKIRRVGAFENTEFTRISVHAPFFRFMRCFHALPAACGIPFWCPCLLADDGVFRIWIPGLDIQLFITGYVTPIILSKI